VGVKAQSGTLYKNLDISNNTTAGKLIDISIGTKPIILLEGIDSQIYYRTTNTVDTSYDVSASSVPTISTSKSIKVGSLSKIITNSFNGKHSIPPIIDIRQPMISSLALLDICTITVPDTSNYIIGETVYQTGIISNTQAVVVGSISSISIGDLATTGSIGSPGSIGVVVSIDIPTKTVYLRQTTGTFTSGLTFVSTSGGNTTITSSSNTNIVPTGYGIIIGKTNISLIVKLLPINGFAIGGSLIGASSGYISIISTVALSGATQGSDMKVTSSINFTTNATSKVSINNSGYGFKNNEPVNLYSKNQIVAKGIAKTDAIAKNEGIFENNKGQLGGPTSIYDGDYYQDFSYEIESAIPFDKYKTQTTTNLHVAGTKAFGKVAIEDNLNISVYKTAMDITEV
jgi:hypothetical protein